MSRITEAVAEIPPSRKGTRSRVFEAMDVLTPEEQAEFRELCRDSHHNNRWLSDILTKASGEEITNAQFRDQRTAICRG